MLLFHPICTESNMEAGYSVNMEGIRQWDVLCCSHMTKWSQLCFLVPGFCNIILYSILNSPYSTFFVCFIVYFLQNYFFNAWHMLRVDLSYWVKQFYLYIGFPWLGGTWIIIFLNWIAQVNLTKTKVLVLFCFFPLRERVGEGQRGRES